MVFDVELADPTHLSSLLAALKSVDGVFDAFRQLPDRTRIHERRRHTLQAPTGTHDVLAPNSAEWEGVVATFAQFAYRYGFELIITPMFEDVGVFNRGIGEESDVAKKENVRVLRPRGSDLRVAPGGYRARRSRLHPAQSHDAVEDVVRDTGLSLRAPPGRALSPAPPTRRRGARHR